MRGIPDGDIHLAQVCLVSEVRVVQANAIAGEPEGEGDDEDRQQPGGRVAGEGCRPERNPGPGLPGYRTRNRHCSPNSGSGERSDGLRRQVKRMRAVPSNSPTVIHNRATMAITAATEPGSSADSSKSSIPSRTPSPDGVSMLR